MTAIAYRCDRAGVETTVNEQDMLIPDLPDGWAVTWICKACWQIHQEPLNLLMVDFLEHAGFSLADALIGEPA